MTDVALKTLIYGLNELGVSDTGRTLFVNARIDHGVRDALSGDITYVQWFKPYADGLSGGEALQRIEDVSGVFDSVFILIPKNIVEARYLIAKSLMLLKNGGDVFCVCENKAGGTRLQKIVQQFGVEIVQQISKHKCRFVRAKNNEVDAHVVEKCIIEGSVQALEKTQFISQAGVYGWNKIDRGSAVLLQHIPQDLKGKIADFGCGYGYLLQHILQQNDGIKMAYGIDADARALDVAGRNVEDARAQYLWEDLTQSDGIPTRLDAIIMNPPFHEGKKTDSDIGVAFIKTAASCLKRGGALYMVANNQLPYEAVLNDVFFTAEVLAQEGGFKVFKALV